MKVDDVIIYKMYSSSKKKTIYPVGIIKDIETRTVQYDHGPEDITQLKVLYYYPMKTIEYIDVEDDDIQKVTDDKEEIIEYVFEEMDTK